jgi:exodeoxyribonuclease VII small subunit
MSKQFDFAASIKELEEINKWFQSEDIDLDEGLQKLKRGKELIQLLKGRLKNVENEFTKIKSDFNDSDGLVVEVVTKTETTNIEDDEEEDDIPF